jgi:hypothetical protein
MEKWVIALEISINRDFFGEEHADLIPYAVEHEIYESWLWAKRGFHHPESSEVNHLLARRRQFEMAMKDGKAEKLLNFYKDKSPESASELQYAYERAKEKQKRQTTIERGI